MVTDLYGFTSAKLADLTDILKEILGVQFVFRSSDFFGDYYRSTPESTENIRLVLNYYEGEEEWLEPTFKDYNVLLYVYDSNEAKKIEELLCKAPKVSTSQKWKLSLGFQQQQKRLA